MRKGVEDCVALVVRSSSEFTGIDLGDVDAAVRSP